VAWDAVGDFSVVSKTPGDRSYQWRDAAPEDALMDVPYAADCGGKTYLACWTNALLAGDIGLNVSGFAVRDDSVTLPLAVPQMRPGPTGERPVLAWTAPRSGQYRITGQFQTVDHAPTGVEVVVGSGHTVLLRRALHAFGATAQFNFQREMRARETLWFAVDAHGDSASDATTVDVGILPLD
jgi:hypothetical protein